jgi:antitoxin HicB
MNYLDYYMGLNYKIMIIENESRDGYIFTIPDLSGCHSEAKTISDGLDKLNDVKQEWLHFALLNGTNIPEPVQQNHCSGEFRLRIPRELHKTLIERSREEGVSLNQFCMFILSRNLKYNAKRDKFRNDLWRP